MTSSGQFIRLMGITKCHENHPSIAQRFRGILTAVNQDGRGRASSIICILFLEESRKTAVISASVWLYYIPGKRVALDVPCALLLHTTESISNLIFSSLLFFFLSFFFLPNAEFHLLGKWSVKLKQKLQIIVPFGRWTAQIARQRVSLGESGRKVS